MERLVIPAALVIAGCASSEHRPVLATALEQCAPYAIDRDPDAASSLDFGARVARGRRMDVFEPALKGGKPVPSRWVQVVAVEYHGLDKGSYDEVPAS